MNLPSRTNKYVFSRQARGGVWGVLTGLWQACLFVREGSANLRTQSRIHDGWSGRNEAEQGVLSATVEW